MTRILGIDPGLVHCGWGIIEHRSGSMQHVASGTISPPTKTPISNRLHFIDKELQTVYRAYAPDEAGIEESFVSVNGKTTLKLGQARGAILLSLANAGIPTSEYAPRLVKKSVVGSGSADKTQILMMVNTLLPGCAPETEHAADALAIAITHAHHGKILVES